ncbi:MAG: hypothetical protein K2H52_14740 [Lachnospiraceae bacterium]|nr:hypothetical protein [Lachnospiraceae bacterium]
MAGNYAGKGLFLGMQDKEHPISLEALRGKWCMKAEYARRMDFNRKRRRIMRWRAVRFSIRGKVFCIIARSFVFWKQIWS